MPMNVIQQFQPQRAKCAIISMANAKKFIKIALHIIIMEKRKSSNQFVNQLYYLRYFCYLIKADSRANKCVYFNRACSTVKKSCLELSDESSVDKEICESAPTWFE